MPDFQSPAPVGGWNARDDLGNMPPEDAVVLRNWRPRPGRCETRAGTSDFISPAVSNSYDQVGTIATFRSTFGDILIWSGGNLLFGWDGISASTLTPLNSDANNDTTGATFWDSAHFNDRLIMTLGDGVKPAQVITYNGTTISSADLNITTGPDEEDIRGVQVHKGRAYYWETASQSFWYAAAGAFQGDLTEFDLSASLRSGGALQMMVSISIDGGGGKDDIAAFIFSSGEALVYQGDDPGDAASWELIGSFEIGQTVDPQAHCKLAGTELIMTRDGIVDLSASLQTGRFGESSEFSSKITKAVTEAARNYVDNFGWQLIHAPGDNCVILNVPLGDGEYVQYVRETETGGWWECTGWDGRFTVFNDQLHMVILDVDNPKIVRCFDGSADFFKNPAGEPLLTAIETAAMPAFTTVRNPSLRKILTNVKPFTNYGTLNSLQITGRADFDKSIPTAPDAAIDSTVSRTSPNVSTFANGNFITYILQTNEEGQQIEWNSSTLFYDQGGPV